MLFRHDPPGQPTLPLGARSRSVLRRGLFTGLVTVALAGSSVAANEMEALESQTNGDELNVICQRIGNKLGSVSFDECMDVGLELSGARAVSGTPIVVKEYLPLADREARGRVLLVGGIHGDEYSSVSVVFKWMKILNQFHSGLFHWRISPLMNPDGLLRQRSQRMNENGVDLNRNFPSPNWLEETRDYWIRRTSSNPRRFPGDAPLSEPESRWLVDEIESFKPEVIVSVHAPHGVLDFDGPPEAPKRFGSLNLNLLGTYPGSLGRYAGVHRELPVVTIELESAGSMPSVSEQRKIWLDLVRWLKTRLPVEPATQTAR
ncbi:MAG: M14 family murein peptide amidase A [Acidobacteriota bacterium]